jgi:hypothetical protein
MGSVQPAAGITLEDLPSTVWLLAMGVALVGFGFGLEWWGYGVEAGLSGALGLIFVAIAVLGHLGVWVLGMID